MVLNQALENITDVTGYTLLPCFCHSNRWFSSTLGATSESFADALERFCAEPPRHLLITPEAAAAAAGVTSALAALEAPPAAAEEAGGSSGKKQKKKQRAQLVQQLVAQQLVAAESAMAQVDAQGEGGGAFCKGQDTQTCKEKKVGALLSLPRNITAQACPPP